MKELLGDLIRLWEDDPLLGFIATSGVILFGGALLWLLTSSWGNWWKRTLVFLAISLAAIVLMYLGAG